MTWKKQVLVVANVTAASDELLTTLLQRAEREPQGFTLIVPATPFAGGREAAQEKVLLAVQRLRDAGLDADGSVGDGDPIIAVTEAWDPKHYDEIVISTLPSSLSKWLQADLPHRVEKLTGAPVAHIVSQPPPPEHVTMPAPAREKKGVMTPLSVLGWGGGPRPR